MRKSKKDLIKDVAIHIEVKPAQDKYNPYQTGHGVFEDKDKKRSFRKSKTRKEIKAFENGQD